MEVDYGDMDIDNSSEDLFVFHESVPTLQKMASHTVALQLWHHFLSRAKRRKIQERSYFFLTVFNLNENYENESEKLVELLKTPQRIEKMLKKSLKKICTETEEWIHHFRSFTEGIFRYCVRVFDPNHIIWRPNGEIDGERSASKILTEGKLNTEQKFVLMCAHAMAEELERFPMNSLPESFQWLGISDMKVGYWISHHRQDLREIWRRLPEMNRPEDTSINVTMAIECASQSLPYAFEYFWKRLSEVEQLAVVPRIVPDLKSKEVRKIMLSTMSYFQQLQLVDQIPIELMTNFSVTGNSTKNCMPENVFRVWTLVKDRITEQQFEKFLENVLNDEEVMYCEKYMIMLNNIWDTASDRLKRHVVENHGFLIFNAFMFCKSYPPSSYRLFMNYVPLLNERTRKDFFWPHYSDADLVAGKRDTDIWNLCLPKESDRLQLKDWVLKSSGMMKYCADKLVCLEFDEAINAVAFFSRNARDSRKFYMKLLEPKELESSASTFILDYENWNKFSNFIDVVLTDDFSTISTLKKQLVSSFSVREVDCWDKKENFSVLVKITEQVFSTEEVKTFKQTLLKRFQKMISSRTSWRNFEGKCYDTFISWCSEDESRVINLKDVVPIDAFFDDSFRDICSSPNKNVEYQLSQIDEFLKYVCVSDEEVNLVKVRKYFERDRYWIRRVEQIFPSPSPNLLHPNQRTIFKWFLSVEY
ncbi:uncharacterized protein LOC135839954 isoform X1 [Planococcus citri]|uniref:uncharacterized protein LOC135839954 isoform X1 n=1 Tax=Planococcus citri TaxID=170843 RepID=UPI0031F77232